MDNSELATTDSIRAYRDEISLFDLWAVLIRWRLLLVSIWVLMIFVAGIYLGLADRRFESSSVVQIGRIAGQSIIPADDLVLELKEHYRLGDAGRQLPYLASIGVEGDDAVVLRVQAHSGLEARSYLNQVVEKLITEQSQRYELARDERESELRALDSQILALNREIAKLTTAAKSVATNHLVESLLIVQRSTLQMGLPALQRQRAQLQQELSILDTYPTRVLRDATLPDHPSQPQFSLIVGLAFLFGGMLGVMGALFAEFVHQTRKGSTKIPLVLG